MKTVFIANNPRTTRKFVEAVARTLEWARAAPWELPLAADAQRRPISHDTQYTVRR
jgi:ABC-type nitrate/sulfonate/bicarbonate transport system substrate-binding protein